jgi:hypothetical protein
MQNPTIHISSLPNMFFTILLVQRLLLLVLEPLLICCHPHWPGTCKMLVVQMQTEHQIPWTGRASQATPLESFFFKGSLVSWSAVKQKSIALSLTEAEYYVMTHAFKEALWLYVFLSFMKFPVPRPFPILSDNQAACSLSISISISTWSKHIDICHHFIRTHIHDGSFSIIWIPTTNMPADIFTKSLSSIIFICHCTVLRLSVPPSLA